MAKASKTNQSKETKAIIAKAKRQIDNGVNYKEVLAMTKEALTGDFGLDTIQYAKASKSIIDYL